MAVVNPNSRLFIRVSRAYKKPGHPIAYSTPNRVAKYFNIKPEKAKQILEHMEGYTLHREYKQPKYYNPYYVHGRREQVQGDLIDIAAISRENDGTKFLLVLIDIFTKFLWVYPLKNKGGAAMKAAVTNWLDTIDRRPKVLMTDKGTEFTCRPVQQLLRGRGVEWQAAIGTLKASIAERVNKSLQVIIYKYLTQNETVRYIDVLASLVETYNKRGHRTLEGMSPRVADRPRSEAAVQTIHHRRYAKVEERRKEKLPFKVGDVVRLKTMPKKITSSSRAYAIQFQGEYYRIVRINRSLPIALYYIRSMDTGEFIEGGLYANELVKQRGDAFKIERVIRRKVVRGRPMVLIKYRYFGPQWNEWKYEDELIAAV